MQEHKCTWLSNSEIKTDLQPGECYLPVFRLQITYHFLQRGVSWFYCSEVMWEYMVRRTLTVAGLCRKGGGTSLLRDLCNQRVKLFAYLHLVPVKTRGTSIRVHGVVLMRTSCFIEEFCAKSLSVGLFHCQDEEQFYA